MLRRWRGRGEWKPLCGPEAQTEIRYRGQRPTRHGQWGFSRPSASLRKLCRLTYDKTLNVPAAAKGFTQANARLVDDWLEEILSNRTPE